MLPSIPREVAEGIGHFTGRCWVLPALLDWLEHSRDRLFILTAPPGEGKSTVMAWLAGAGPAPDDPSAREELARVRSYVKAAHFCAAESGLNSPRALAEGWSNQLVRNVPGFAPALADSLADRVVITSADRIGVIQPGGSHTGVAILNLNLAGLGDEAGFERTLRCPIKLLRAEDLNRPLVLLVDALDEALAYRGDITVAELLARLDDLPEPVRVLASSRPDSRALNLYPGARRFDLRADAPANSDDVRAYLHAQLAALEGPRRGRLADHIAKAAKGNFLYARLVLHELPRPIPDVDAIATIPLPSRLEQLYTRFLNREVGVRRETRWFDFLRPVLGLVAVAQGDGLARAQLAELTGRAVEPALEVCEPYLAGQFPDGPFRPFHHSFREYLTEYPNNKAYHTDAREMHAAIASFYWGKHHEDWSGCDRYGLDYLATHLAESGDTARLLGLVREAWIRVRHERGNYSYEGPLGDVELAWRAAEKGDEERLRAGRTGPHLADEVRCALCLASICDLAGRIAPAALVSFVDRGVWTPLEAANHARRVTASGSRWRALAALASRVSEPLRGELFTEALVAAGQAGDDEERAGVLTGLLADLPPSLRPEGLRRAVAAVRRLTDTRRELAQGHYQKYWDTVTTGLRQKALGRLTQALAGLCPGLDGAALAERLRAACEVEDEASCGRAVDELASHLAEPPEKSGGAPGGARVASAVPQPHDLSEAVPRIGDAALRARALLRLACYLGEALDADSSRDALEAVRGGEPEGERAELLTALAPYLADALLPDALAAVRCFSPKQIAGLLVTLAPRLPDGLLPEALDAVRQIDYLSPYEDKVRAVASLAARWPDELFRNGGLIRTTFPGPTWPFDFPNHVNEADVLVAVVPHLPAARLGEALTAAAALAEAPRADVLAALAPRLPAAMLDQALQLARAIGDDKARAQALAALGVGPPKGPAPAAESAGPGGGATPPPSAPVPEDVGEPAEALARAAGLAGEAARVQALVELAPRLDEALLPAALELVRGLPLGEEHARALAALIPGLPEAMLAEALDMVRALALSWPGRKAKPPLLALLPRLPAPLLRPAAELAADLGARDAEVLRALVAVLPRLPEAERVEVLTQAFQLAGSQGHDVGERITATLALAPLLPASLLEPALRQLIADIKVARHPGRGYQTWNLHHRYGCFVSLLPLSVTPPGAAVLAEGLAILEALPVAASEAAARLADFAPYLSRESLPRVERIDPEGTVVRLLPGPLLGDALEAAGAARSKDWLFAVTVRLPDALLPRAVEVAGVIGGDALKGELLASYPEVLTRLPAPELHRAWRDGLHGLAGGGREKLLRALQTLPPVMAKLGGRDAVRGSLAVIRDVGRWWR